MTGPSKAPSSREGSAKPWRKAGYTPPACKHCRQNHDGAYLWVQYCSRECHVAEERPNLRALVGDLVSDTTGEAADPAATLPVELGPPFQRECVVCGVRFEAKKRTAKTCSGPCRKDLLRVRRGERVLSIPSGGERCTYCGASATTEDHVTPRAYLQSVQSAGHVLSTEVVPCCRECNSVAGASVFPSRAAKGRWLGRRLAERYTKLLETPDWSEGELTELGYTLRTAVDMSIAMRDVVRARLDWNRGHYPPLSGGGQKASAPSSDRGRLGRENGKERQTSAVA